MVPSYRDDYSFFINQVRPREPLAETVLADLTGSTHITEIPTAAPTPDSFQDHESVVDWDPMDWHGRDEDGLPDLMRAAHEVQLERESQVKILGDVQYIEERMEEEAHRQLRAEPELSTEIGYQLASSPLPSVMSRELAALHGQALGAERTRREQGDGRERGINDGLAPGKG